MGKPKNLIHVKELKFLILSIVIIFLTINTAIHTREVIDSKNEFIDEIQETFGENTDQILNNTNIISQKPKKNEMKYSVVLENYGNIQYFGKIYFGSHNQEMKTIFSTGSSLTWIEGVDCNECRNATRYDNRNSNSYKNLSEQINYKVIIEINFSMQWETFQEI
jgi:hypothetical protein